MSTDPKPAPRMAVRNLKVLAYTEGFTLWFYKAGVSTLADVQGAGFFDDASDMFARGDMVLVCASDGGAALFVAAIADGVVMAPLA